MQLKKNDKPGIKSLIQIYGICTAIKESRQIHSQPHSRQAKIIIICILVSYYWIATSFYSWSKSESRYTRGLKPTLKIGGILIHELKLVAIHLFFNKLER